MAVGELHHAHRLPVALGVGHAEVPLRALADVASLLLTEESDRPAGEASEAADDRRVVGAVPVAVELDEIVQEPFDVVERVRTIGMPSELDGPPDLVRARRGRGGETLELPLQALELAGQLRAAEQGQAPQPREPLAEAELRLTRHR